MRASVHMASLLALAACGGSAGTGGDTDADGGARSSDAGGRADDGSTSPSNDASDGITNSGSGGGTIDGSVGGTPFGSATSSLWLGSPDAPGTTVVYVFSKPVACSELATPGWDTRITNGTQMLEMKMFGTAPATYRVVTTQTPGPGEAAVNYTLSSTSGTPSEQVGSGGTATLSSVTATTRATGSFALDFATSRVTGTFDATFCSGGHEP